MFHLVIVLNALCLSKDILPDYTPALRKDKDVEGELAIKSFFLQGFTNVEIVGFLAVRHDIVLSVCTLKRILKRLRLTRVRRTKESPLGQIAVSEELNISCGSFMGYRQLTRRLRRKCNLQVRRDTLMNSLCVIDPEGVERRKRRSLKRRKYSNPGPNFLWRVDGWHKPAPFGFFIHGEVDGFSRRILWLEVNSTNKNPRVIAAHYLNTVRPP